MFRFIKTRVCKENFAEENFCMCMGVIFNSDKLNSFYSIYTHLYQLILLSGSASVFITIIILK